MRVVFFILVIFVWSLAAQTPNVRKAFDAGTQNAQSEKFEMAIEDYRRTLLLAGIEKASKDFLARVHFNLGVCFYRLKQAEKAALEFKEAIKLSGGAYQKAFYALGMAEKDSGKLKKAENAFRRALKIEKSDAEAWFDIGMLYLQKRDFDAAFEAFKNAVRFESVAAADARNNLGVIFALRHEFDSAEKQFEIALAISDGKSNLARKNLQFCRDYRRKNQFENLTAVLEFSLIGRDKFSN